jgi:phosphoribulokinase
LAKVSFKRGKKKQKKKEEKEEKEEKKKKHSSEGKKIQFMVVKINEYLMLSEEKKFIQYGHKRKGNR